MKTETSMKQEHHPRCGIIVLAIASALPVVSASPARAAVSQATFHGLGDVSGGVFSSSATAVSGDGNVVVGGGQFLTAGVATRWVLNPDGSISSTQSLGVLNGDAVGSIASAVSFDGSAVVGTTNSIDAVNGTEAFRWTAVVGMNGLGDLPGNNFQSTAKGVSADGSVVVGDGLPLQDIHGSCPPISGAGRIQAFRWTAGGGMIGLEFPPGLNRPHSAANCISNDGSIIAGSLRSEPTCSGLFFEPPVMWVNGIVSVIGTDPKVFNDVSPDGTAFVGTQNQFQDGFLWTGAGGFVPIGSTTQPRGVSTNGQVVVGVDFITPLKAFIWDSANGKRYLQDVLINDFGVTNLTGWNLTFALGISDDGLTIVGYGTNPSGQTEGWVVRLPSPDTDGDGLLDDWEVNGIPFTDAFGAQQRYELDFDGIPGPDCDANRKDIFVEVDAMNGFAPNPAAYLAVKEAFNTAPVSNPNGAAPGIKLHIIEDELDIPAGDWTKDDTNGNGEADWPTEFDALKLSAVRNPPTLISGYFGSIDERNFDNTVADATAVREAKAKAFRYCIFGRSLDATTTPPSTGPSGIAEIRGNDFMVTLGLWSDGAGGGATLQQQAGTFMHELGHALGLRHGGIQFDSDNDGRFNYKPNYYSVMNYSYTTPKPWMPPGTWPLDANRGGFSKFALPTLNEASLNECQAQVVPGSALAGTIFISSYVDRNRQVAVSYGRYDMPNDWNENDNPPDCENPVAVDINRLMIVAGQPVPPATPGDMLSGHDDWAVLHYNFRDQPCFALGVHNSEDGEASVIDITFEENQALASALPPFCAGDIINDRTVNIDDLLAVISAWGACPQGCLADITPLPADGVVNIDDLLAVISAWGACR